MSRANLNDLEQYRHQESLRFSGFEVNENESFRLDTYSSSYKEMLLVVGIVRIQLRSL